MALAAVIGTAYAQAIVPSTVEIERRQTEQQAVLLQQTTRTVNVNTPTGVVGSVAAQPEWQAFTVPSEAQSPCFKINAIEWKGSDLFDWLIFYPPITRSC